MKMRSVALAVKAKGHFAFLGRARSISSRYGLTPAKMYQALDLFSHVLDQFGCGASFPLTAIVLKKQGARITKYLERNIEFVVHGLRHIDYTQLSSEDQLSHLVSARRIFEDAGIPVRGFRAPYLRHNANLRAAIEAVEFSYASNQPIMWNVIDFDSLSESALAAYKRAINFYDPWYSDQRLSLPRLEDRLIEIPVSLPDDEILLDRLGGEETNLVSDAWQRILLESYRRGELFAIQLHPERIAECADGLSAVLTQARALKPSIWIARLDEICSWWRARTDAEVKIDDLDHESIRLVVTGPSGTTVLARGVEMSAPTRPWTNGFEQVEATEFTVHSSHRPFIGVSPTASSTLVDFLRQQGYIVEVSSDRQRYLYYFENTDFTADHELPLLTHIEKTAHPLVRLGRWPNGDYSAVCVTGDIDALTLVDYGLRLFGG